MEKCRHCRTAWNAYRAALKSSCHLLALPEAPVVIAEPIRPNGSLHCVEPCLEAVELFENNAVWIHDGKHLEMAPQRQIRNAYLAAANERSLALRDELLHCRPLICLHLLKGCLFCLGSDRTRKACPGVDVSVCEVLAE